MQRTGISINGIHHTLEGPVNQRVREIVSTWDIEESYAQSVHANLIAGVAIAISAYGHTPVATQVHIAIYTLLIISIDDFITTTDAMEEFMTRLHSGVRQLDPILQYLVENLAAMPDYFPADAAKAISTSSIIFVNQTLLDKKLERMPLHQEAREYVESKRMKNGVAEAYAYFIWDKETFPDIQAFIQSIPDIFSFYKEELAGEMSNYVHERARVTKKAAELTLMDMMNDVIDAVHRARAIVQTNVQKEALEHFLVGYVVFYFTSQRYRLYELTGSEYV
ncbi:hypothetical protein EIP86_010177 [Pleurotus ostreatoroseus]|nr:hypothetical protein EIP86_010177 [Pleurotus ostreatoroseus]